MEASGQPRAAISNVGVAPRTLIWVIAVLDSVVFVAGIALTFVPGIPFEAAMAGAMFVVLIVTFLGMMSIAQNVKNAIAAAFVVAYFSILLLVLFADVAKEAGEGSVPRDLLDNFTTLTGIVVASYFGTLAIQTISDNASGRAAGPRRGDLPTLANNTFGESSDET